MSQRPFSRQDMTALLVGFGLMISVVVFFAARNATPSGSMNPTTEAVPKAGVSLPTVSATEARQKTFSKTPTKIIDIRSEIEYQASHIPDSLSIPAEKLSEYFPSQKGEELLIVPAQNEAVSASAADILSGKEVRYAFIGGGIIAWEQSGGQVISFGNPSSPTDRSKVTLVSADDFKAAIEDQEMLHAIVDVRNSEAFAKAHIPEAINIPLSELERRRSEIPPATNIALYAENGLEAFQAAVRLFDLGMFSVKTLDINFSEWEAKGFPVVKK